MNYPIECSVQSSDYFLKEIKEIVKFLLEILCTARGGEIIPEIDKRALKTSSVEFSKVVVQTGKHLNKCFCLLVAPSLGRRSIPHT